LHISVQLVRFAIVGVLNTVLHLAVVAILTQIFGMSQLISNSAAYLVASSFSFVVNSIWSFQARPDAHRYIRFQLVGLIGLAVCAFFGYLGDAFGWHYVMTVLVTVCIVPFISFLAHRSYTYSR
jgi:putative flippase GtrA